MSQVTILFVHSGQADPPICMAQSLVIAYRIAKASKIIALINQRHIHKLEDCVRAQLSQFEKMDGLRLQFIAVESLDCGGLSEKFSKEAKADRNFRNGFWLETANRFMLIADLMKQLKMENCLHLENDNVLYFDPTLKIDIFRRHARFAVPFDRSRAIPGVVWYQDALIASDLADYMQMYSDEPDFDLLRKFCDCGEYDAKPLPTMSRSYAISKNLPIDKFCFGYEEFGGIFDAAAVGQYIGGVDPRNIAGDSRFFINETSDLNVGECEVVWNYCDEQRNLMLMMNQECVPVLTLHAHSKDSLGVSPFNRVVIKDEAQIITGERIQEYSDITIASSDVLDFHGEENIRSKKIAKIPNKEVRKFFKKKIVESPPEEAWIDDCKEARIIFVYTHLIPYFKQYVAPRLQHEFTLVSHNSDHGVSINDLDLLNHPYLIRWFAQNCEFSHEKLCALPIGITNRQWGSDKYSLLKEANKISLKTKLVYANFSVHTHPSRQELFEFIGTAKNVTCSGNLGYREYLNELTQHKFCLCPRGNGIDTHRFWEAQYLNVIPIILESDWTASYSGLPILVVREWKSLLDIDLNKEHIRISSSLYRFNSLDLSIMREKLSKNILIHSA